MSVTSPTAWAKSWVQAGDVMGQTRMDPGCIRSNSWALMIRLAGAVIVPGLTSMPRRVSLESSFLNWVSLNSTPGFSLASSGIVPGGRVQALARLPEFPAVCCEGEILGHCLAEPARCQGGLDLVACEEVEVIRLAQGTDVHQPLPQLGRNTPQRGPGRAEHKAGLLAHGVVLIGEPHPVAELPVLERLQQFADLREGLFPLARRLCLVPGRVVVGPLYHVLEGHEHGGRVFLLGWLAEIEAVALVTVGREYIRYPLSLRQVEDILFERGIDTSHEIMRYWWNRFGPKFAGEIRKRRVEGRSYLNRRWHLDGCVLRSGRRLTRSHCGAHRR